MRFASLARISALLVAAAFAAGCAQDEATGSKIRNAGAVDSTDDGASGSDPSETGGSTNNTNDNVAKPVTPANAPATTTPAAKPIEKAAIACGTDIDSVTQSYAIALQRKPDDGGLQNWVGIIQQGETRLGVLKRILQSTEFNTAFEQLTNAEFVTSLYRSFFDRDPDAAGLAGWVGNLDGGGSRSGIAIAFADSEEFKSPNSNRAVACYF